MKSKSLETLTCVLGKSFRSVWSIVNPSSLVHPLSCTFLRRDISTAMSRGKVRPTLIRLRNKPTKTRISPSSFLLAHPSFSTVDIFRCLPSSPLSLIRRYEILVERRVWHRRDFKWKRIKLRTRIRTHTQPHTHHELHGQSCIYRTRWTVPRHRGGNEEQGATRGLASINRVSSNDAVRMTDIRIWK